MSHSSEQSISCPKCNHTMNQLRVENDITVDRCVNCGGLFLDVFEKEYLVLAKQRAEEVDLALTRQVDDMDQVRAITCPRDQSRMIHIQALENPDVGLETCTICGSVFLDAGELTQITKKSLLDRIKQAIS